VVGDPDAGAHTRIIRAYGCGDLCVDINGCPLCPVTRTADITEGPVAGLANDSAVVFVSCVLEYVSDPEAALYELQRIAGSPANLFLVFVEPWTLTAALYPGARWAGGAMNSPVGKVAMQPVTTTRKVATAGVLVGLLALAARRPRPRRRTGSSFTTHAGACPARPCRATDELASSPPRSSTGR
jgi:hypothetical protein